MNYDGTSHNNGYSPTGQKHPLYNGPEVNKNKYTNIIIEAAFIVLDQRVGLLVTLKSLYIVLVTRFSFFFVFKEII